MANYPKYVYVMYVNLKSMKELFAFLMKMKLMLMLSSGVNTPLFIKCRLRLILWLRYRIAQSKSR